MLLTLFIAKNPDFFLFSTEQKDDAESSGKTEDSLYQLLQEYMLENNKLKETNRSRLTSSSLIEKLASKTFQSIVKYLVKISN